MSKIKCPWCDHEIDIAMDSCGTDSTWMLLKCSSCGKFAASGSIPDFVKNDPEVKIVRIFGYQDNYAVGYTPELSVTTGAAHTAIGGDLDRACLSGLHDRNVGIGPKAGYTLSGAHYPRCVNITVSSARNIMLGPKAGCAKAGAVMLGPKAGCAKATNKKL